MSLASPFASTGRVARTFLSLIVIAALSAGCGNSSKASDHRHRPESAAAAVFAQ